MLETGPPMCLDSNQHTDTIGLAVEKYIRLNVNRRLAFSSAVMFRRINAFCKFMQKSCEGLKTVDPP